MTVTYSAAKVGKRFFWAVQTTHSIYCEHAKALAEGFALTKEEALDAARNAVAELGIEAREGFSYYATSYIKHCREALNKPHEPQTSTFQGSPHIWRNGSYFDDYDCKHVSYWETHQVVKVTNKYVFITRVHSDGCMRLDRVALERNGTVSVGRYDYYTEAGHQAALAKEAEKELQRQDERAIQLEQNARRAEATRSSS